MKQEANRVIDAIELWRDREERFEKLFPGTLNYNKPFLKEKLHYHEKIAPDAGILNEEGRTTFRMLKPKIGKIKSSRNKKL